MVRNIALTCAMAAAFAVGFFLVSQKNAERRATADAMAYLDIDAERSSTFYPVRRVASSVQYKKTVIAILDSAPTARAQSEPETRTNQAGPRVAFALPPKPRSRPVERTHTQLVAFAASPFPYTGRVPRTNRPFLNYRDDGRLGRKTYGGRVYWADETYNDRRVLLHIPEGFDARKPAVMVLFFHGHGATLERDVAARQRVPQQITESGMNAVLVAPQFAVDARDSSAGNFWKPGGVERFLDEVADKLARLDGDPTSRAAFAKMPIVIVGYSGGYAPTAWALESPVVEKRLKGTVLLDGLYGEIDKFERWVARNRSAFFLSAYTGSTARGNAALKHRLRARKIPYRTEVAGALAPGSVTFVAADERHRHYVTRAWTDHPINDVLVRMTGGVRRADTMQSASLDPVTGR